MYTIVYHELLQKAVYLSRNLDWSFHLRPSRVLYQHYHGPKGNHMKHILYSIAALGLFLAPVYAQNGPVVVELYTSQGCSSCPPADQMMEVLAERDDVIALSLHVDYWDYIGWKDEFADPNHAKRQRAYAAEAGRRSVYTPEMIVNGVSDIVGAKPIELAMAIEKHKSTAHKVAIDLTRNGDALTISARLLDQAQDAMTVQVLRYQPQRSANITRGENAGRSIRYVNVAQDWQIVSAWDGAAPFYSEVAVPGTLPVVVLVQQGASGPILGAAKLD